MKEVARNILDYHFDLCKNKEILIVSDDSKIQLAEAICEELSDRDSIPILMTLDYAQKFPNVLENLFAVEEVGLILLVTPKSWANKLMTYLTFKEGELSLNVKCQPVFFDGLLPLDSLLRVYSGNYQQNISYLNHLKNHFQPDTLYRVTSSTGTDISFIARDWQISKWTEVHTSPLEESINGLIVADTSVFFSKVKLPIELEIKNGKLVRINCQDENDKIFQQYKRFMQESIREDENNWQVAEFGIGGNLGAKISGIIMEDEAVKDTCHFCFGDNKRYGGLNKSAWHGGTVLINKPIIEFEKKG